MNQEGCNMKHVQQFSIILLISVIGELLKTFLPLPLFPIRITPCVTFPVTTITITVLINVMMRTGTQIGFRVLQAVISPAPAGTNITGMISTRKSAAPLT